MIDTRVDPRSMRLVEDALNAANRKTSWALGTAESKAMYYICRSGSTAVKPKSMKTKRKIVDNPKRVGVGRKATGAKHAVKVLRQSGSTSYVPTNVKTGNAWIERVRKISKLGLASKAFKLASAVFQANIRGETVRLKKTSNLFESYRSSRGNKVNVGIEIFLSYIEKHRPHAVSRAIKRGMASFIHEFDRDWASAIKEGRY